MYDRSTARLIKRGAFLEAPAPRPAEREPPLPERGEVERTEFRDGTLGRMLLAARGANGCWIRLDAVLPARMPPELAEELIRRGEVPGRLYRSGFALCDAEALRKAWAIRKGVAA